MKTRIFVDGQEGTTGLQIHQRLSGREDLELLAIDPARRKDPVARAECLNSADVAFLCLPDAAAKEAVALLSSSRTIVIDASTAHRTDPDWAYGLPELGPDYRNRIRSSHRIANTGCHAAAFLLGVRPLVEAGLVPRDFPVSAFSITGYSGGGKKMIAEYENSPRPALSSPRPYALGLAHKHLPEMRAHSGLSAAPIFNPIVAAFYQGMAVTIPLPLRHLPRTPQPQDIHAALVGAYTGERFVRVLPCAEESILDAGALDVQACNGTNRADVMVFGQSDQAVVIVRIDNLGKGASGAAIQCMNLRLGLDEGLGLTT